MIEYWQRWNRLALWTRILILIGASDLATIAGTLILTNSTVLDAIQSYSYSSEAAKEAASLLPLATVGALVLRRFVPEHVLEVCAERLALPSWGWAVLVAHMLVSSFVWAWLPGFVVLDIITAAAIIIGIGVGYRLDRNDGRDWRLRRWATDPIAMALPRGYLFGVYLFVTSSAFELLIAIEGYGEDLALVAMILVVLPGVVCWFRYRRMNMAA